MTTLWTFQGADVADALKSSRFVPSWEFVPANWEVAYRLMSDKLAEKLGHAIESPPVWCWHSCGNPGIGPTVQTALSLFGSSISQVERVTIRLDVPDDYMVLSSYFCWCEILNLVIEGTPVEQDSLSEMLSEPLMSPEGDDVQAVLPYIDPRWVVAICPLVTANRSTHLPV